VRSPVAEAVVPAAGWLLRRIAGEPGEAVSAAIVGPGGMGKSRLLRGIANAYELAGIAVRMPERDADLSALPDDRPILVDDAHRLDATTLAGLRDRVRNGDARMVVAYRPWPQPVGLSALGAQLSRHHSPIVLGHLGRDETAEQVARRVGRTPPDSLIALVHEQAGGSPMFAGLVTQALLDTGRFDPQHPELFRRPNRVSVSPGLAERLRYMLEALDPRIYALLEAMAFGTPLDAEILCALLETDLPSLADTVEAARAAGLLTEGGELIVFVRNLVLRLMPVLRGQNLRRRLAEIQLASGAPVLLVGQQLADAKATGARAAAVLAAAADEALRTNPRQAVALYDAAVLAGSSPHPAARRAQAAALAGDAAQALRLADEILATPQATDRHDALLVSAAILIQRGFATRAAELYQGMTGADALLAVPALLAVGELDRAKSVLDKAPASEQDAPTLTASAIRLLAAGMIDTVDGDLHDALRQLVQAADLVESAGEAVLLPYCPAELLAVVAAQCGEVALAESTLGRATSAGIGGGLTYARNLLLHGWHALLRGALDTARGMLDRIAAERIALEPADELIAAALAAGLARREGDSAALGAAFERGRTALIRHPVDLFRLRQLGELAIASAMLDLRGSLTAHLDQAFALLDRLGNPPLWTAPLHWSLLHADLIAGDLDAAAGRAAALSGLATKAAHVGPFAAAAAAWLRVVDEDDITTVREAAHGLLNIGQVWEGARLAATAAEHSADRKIGANLLALARNLNDGTPEPAPADSDPEPDPAAALLSERELEVGRLILAGLTHKQIGARLFISGKTVEHHVARMRHRLGADGRDELFGMLRRILGGNRQAAAQTSDGTGEARLATNPSQVRITAR
jgi:DNA-binding CsgD family transcriptional regulator